MEDKYLPSMTSVPLATLVKEEYRQYQIYTLMDRAIPYLQDGLKPSQRRILYTLWKNSNRGLIKVSSLTGLVLTLHPHGPQSVEASIVNLAQDFCFSNNYPLLDKKGYFGERMETNAAAARYIESKLGKVAELLLFDDMNQVGMVPNYDEKVMEPVALLPKLPLMLLNGAEGIGTGFSSVIPSFNHKDIVKSMIQFVETGKCRKIKPWVRYYSEPVEIDENNRILFRLGFKQVGEKIYITELPRGYDAQRVYRHLNKYMEKDFLKDYIDSSVDNDIRIELIFKRGMTPTLEEVVAEMGSVTSLVPNYTVITDRGVKVFQTAEEIIEVFTAQRLVVVKKRYELLIKDADERLQKNNEIIRFIKEKHYAIAEKKANRKDYVDYLTKEKFVFADYLADMAIYRMTKEEVEKRQLLIKEDQQAIAEYKKILKSPEMIKKKLIEELQEVDQKLTEIMDQKEKEKKRSAQKSPKAPTRSRQ
jgi:DNA gyrase subunit A